MYLSIYLYIFPFIHNVFGCASLTYHGTPWAVLFFANVISYLVQIESFLQIHTQQFTFKIQFSVRCYAYACLPFYLQKQRFYKLEVFKFLVWNWQKFFFQSVAVKHKNFCSSSTYEIFSNDFTDDWKKKSAYAIVHLHKEFLTSTECLKD